MNALTPWSDQVTARLIELWPHHSGLQCAAMLNTEFNLFITRQAVIGKATRLGIASMSKTTRHPMDFSHRARLGDRTVVPRAPSLRFANPKPRREPPPMACEVPPLNLTLAEKPDNGCCFIPGSDYLYCGHPKWAASSYCAFHHRVVWSQPKARVETRPSFKMRGWKQ